ncbi:hypothetical protein KY290_019536 [Solanum tuberosum]|uniref:Bax inhibitor n=1 Tax=Solanum tuberosum TaxID=4113 RepID=A0ABQ7VJF9_SOLTU|nr:hypothetical protein KY284_018427 [Solanum tuberosum]KAH0763463.1 hypothetical protein KY290_019536 [Solanum tuberosum]
MDFLVNAVKAYFDRSWSRKDMMSLAPIPQNDRTSLNRVYLTLYWAMMCSSYGSFLHLFWELGGLLPVFLTVASVLRLHFTSPERVMKRVSLLMISAFFFGASVVPFTKYFFTTDQIIGFFVGAAISIGGFLYLAMKTGERSIIYLGCLTLACFLMFSSIIVNDLFSSFIDSHTAHLMLKVATMQTLFIGYFVLYSQEILYDARFGNINAVNRTLTIFFHLPAVVIHATRLCLRVKTQRRPTHRIVLKVHHRINRKQNADGEL